MNSSPRATAAPTADQVGEPARGRVPSAGKVHVVLLAPPPQIRSTR